MIVAPGAASVSVTVQIVDDTGLPVTGLVAATFPTTYYQRAGESLPASITLSDLAAQNSAYSSGGVKELAGGYYRLDVPDAAFATAARVRLIGEATNKRLLYPVVTCAFIQGDARQWLGGTIPAVNVTGVPLVDAKYLLGTAFSTPTVAGVPNVNVKTWNDLVTVALPLTPTTAGRTLDVSAGGEAGVDWANVGSPTTAVNLSGTTVNLVNTATTLTNLPAITAGWLTATGIAADAITAAKIADGAIDAATFAAGAITATVLAADCIGASQIATDAIGSAELAASAVSEIQSGLATTANQATIIGYIDTEVAAILAAVDTEVAAIKAKTDNLPASPAATGDAMTLTAGERDSVAAALLDLANGVETSVTVRKLFRLTAAVLGGKSANGGADFRNLADTKTVVDSTLDGSGNRTAVTLDLT